MDKARIFLLASLSFIFGVFCASFFYPDIFSAFLARLILVSAVIFFFVFYKNKTAALVSFCLVIFIFGFWLTERKIDKIIFFKNSASQLDFSGRGIIASEPKIKDKYQEIIFTPTFAPIAIGAMAGKENFKILIQESRYREYFYGDELRLTCELELPKNMEDSDFNYQAYLAKDDIFYLCKKPQIENLLAGGGKNSGNKFYSAVIKIKNKLSGNIFALISSPEAGLLEGLIIGGDDKLSKEVQGNFSRSGMTHIVAVSGYNITIVAQYLMLLGIFLGLWRRQAFWFAVLGIWIFILMTGFPSSAIRAGVMGTLLLYAMKNGRLANAGNAILFSAAVMLLWNPLLLRYDVGFQLSFLATIGIVYCYPLLENYSREKLQKLPAIISFLAEILFLSLSAQIFVLPIILFNFQKLSIVSPLANILILPILPITMLLGFSAVASSFVFHPLAVFFSWLAYIPLHYEVLTINYLANLKYSFLEASLSRRGVFVWYIILTGAIYYFRKK